MSKLAKVCGRLASIILVAASVSIGLADPVSAAKLDLYNPNKRYADEKKVIADPASRCNTPEMRKMRDQAAQQAASYASKYGIKSDSTGPTKEAHDEYQNGIAIAWEALEQPYCGFGAFGVSAVRKSFQKSLNRLQSNFLARMKGAVPANQAQNEVARAIKTSAIISEDRPAEPVKVVRQAHDLSSPKVEKAEPEAKAQVVKKAKLKIVSKLEKSDESEEVRILQELLAKDKKIYPQAVVTGYFGELTKQAVIRFQLKYKIIKSKDDDGAGLVGPKTRTIMNQALGD